MRIICQTQDWWDTQEGFRQRCSGGPACLARWVDTVRHLFSPVVSCITSGTFSPVPDRLAPDVVTVTAGVQRTHPYDCQYWNYSLCAWEAGFYWAMNRNDWDILIQLDTECLIGDVNLDSLLRLFMESRYQVMSPAWGDGKWIGGPMIAFKRAGVSRWLNSRKRANLVSEDDARRAGLDPVLPEQEMTEIFGSLWVNPWPEIPSMRYDFPHEPSTPERRAEAMKWPFVRLPDPELTESYLIENCPKAKPVTSKPVAGKTAQA